MPPLIDGDGHHRRRWRARGLGAPDRRPVDDQHRHRRCRRRRCPGRGARPRRQRAGPGHRQHRGGRGGRPEIVAGLDRIGVAVPVIGDFHYNGHLLLTRYPACARALAKYRINPGNVGGKRHDENFRAIVEVALAQRQAGAIGVNWGSLDQNLLTEMMDANARRRASGRERREHGGHGRERAAVAALAEATGMAHDRIVLSAKVSGVQDLVDVYRMLAGRCDYPLHLGLTEAGLGAKGIIASTAGLSILLQEGIGDTIRVSLTPAPGGDRTEEVRVAQQVLQSLGLRSFTPQVTALSRLRANDQHVLPADGPGDPGLPAREDAGLADGAARCRGDEGGGDGLRGERSRRVEARQHRHLAARARSRSPRRPCTSTGASMVTLKGDGIVPEFLAILEDYVASRYALLCAPGWLPPHPSFTRYSHHQRHPCAAPGPSQYIPCSTSRWRWSLPSWPCRLPESVRAHSPLGLFLHGQPPARVGFAIDFYRKRAGRCSPGPVDRRDSPGSVFLIPLPGWPRPRPGLAAVLRPAPAARSRISLSVRLPLPPPPPPSLLPARAMVTLSR